MERIPIIIAGLIIWACAGVFKGDAQRKRREDSEYWAEYDKRMQERYDTMQRSAGEDLR